MNQKIAIVTMNPYFSIRNENSAVSIYLKSIGDSLISNGHSVTYFPNNEKSSNSTSTAGKTLSKRVKILLKSIFPSFYFKKRFNRYFIEVEQLHLKAKDTLKDFDIVLEFSSYGGKTVSLFTKEQTKRVIIYDAPLDLQFEEMYHHSGSFSKLIQESESSFVKNADLIFCYSNAVKEYLLKKYSLNQKIVVLPCIVWKSNLVAPQVDEPVIGFIGSFLKWHKTDLLVRAFEEIASKFLTAKLLLVGFGEEWEKVNDYCIHSRFSERIKLTGFVSEKELSQLKSTISIGVMPGSNWYGSPLKLFEYAESGIPVIAPSTPTVNEYFRNNENALIIDPKNEFESLVEKLSILLSDPTIRTRIGTAGQQLMKGDLSKERVMTKFVKEIEILAE
jgi:glycosyltransferase involved in cell wall biosynthesis